ncbi:hypothetical protein [Candidatus Chrysopegis kryptomonas]|uniref:Uncharacterized protein n=1 Tax=Candidatus Chryseopegocella kryptomonas TaxID=1633643 RepID=A0A0P1NW57_9BACT|nr:hypothetical protein [Candidatus Chrysopegis kryptomonas]CUT03450.1 hypothetical protein JGI23_01478 [Candidatus Chrysopegis kryptomonas]
MRKRTNLKKVRDYKPILVKRETYEIAVVMSKKLGVSILEFVRWAVEKAAKEIESGKHDGEQ